MTNWIFYISWEAEKNKSRIKNYPVLSFNYITLKMKLREKQKKGKKKMKARGRGSVDIPQDVFLKMLRS